MRQETVYSKQADDGVFDCDLTICIVTWNGKPLTLDCLASIYAQTEGIRFEVILIDNGSADGTVEAVRAEYPEVKVIPNASNEGFAYANNQAVRIAKGRNAILLNNDTILRENALFKMVQYLDENPNIGALGCRLRFPDGTLQPSIYSDPKWSDYVISAFGLQRLFPRSRLFGRLRMTYIDYENAICDVDWLSGAALMVRRETYEQVGLLDDKILAFSEDWEWCVRIRNGGWRVVYFSEAEIVHYAGMSSHGHQQDPTISEWSMMTVSASSFYTYRKLHAGDSLGIWMYELSRRLYYLSRALVNLCRYLSKPQVDYLGRARGFMRASFTSYSVFLRQYLRQSQ